MNSEQSILLKFQNKDHRGPGKVVKNLIKGLNGINIHSVFNFEDKFDKIGCLQLCDFHTISSIKNSGSRVLLGPNLFVLPTDNPTICGMFSNFVTPSKWVKDLYEQFDIMKNKNIFVWSVGIDTEEWTESYTEKSLDCFIYFKNRTEQDLVFAEAICRKFNLNYKVIRYGSYQENELKDLCSKSKFAILLTGTESQGIAYMEILSSNIPCYVFDYPYWKSDDGKWNVPASSVPYWDDRCGVKTSKLDLKQFELFIEQVKNKTFNPRQYILENHTLEIAARKYIEIFDQIERNKND